MFSAENPVVCLRAGKGMARVHLASGTGKDLVLCKPGRNLQSASNSNAFRISRNGIQGKGNSAAKIYGLDDDIDIQPQASRMKSPFHS
jgi:hypothetical protein